MGFIDVIKEKARADKKTIVLPESMDRRTWVAAEKILKRIWQIWSLSEHRRISASTARDWMCPEQPSSIRRHMRRHRNILIYSWN